MQRFGVKPGDYKQRQWQWGVGRAVASDIVSYGMDPKKYIWLCDL